MRRRGRRPRSRPRWPRRQWPAWRCPRAARAATTVSWVRTSGARRRARREAGLTCSTDGRARAVTGLAVSARVSGFPPTLDRMTRLRAVALAAGLLALAAPLTAQASHRARTTAPATYDVSYPQCGG